MVVEARCGFGRHVLVWGDYMVHTVGLVEYIYAVAALSDDAAQERIGQDLAVLIPEPLRQDLLRRRVPDREWWLAKLPQATQFSVVHRPTRLFVGAFTVHAEEGRINLGGWLAPAYRGHGLGTALLPLALLLAHEHLGHTEIHAGTATDHIASRKVLAAAGFTLVDEHIDHTLPDGRTVQGVRYRHIARGPRRECWTLPWPALRTRRPVRVTADPEDLPPTLRSLEGQEPFRS